MRLIFASLFAITLLGLVALYWTQAPTDGPPQANSEAIAADATVMAKRDSQSNTTATDTPLSTTNPSATIQHQGSTPQSPTEQDDAIAELNGDYPNLDMRLHEMNARSAGKHYDPEAVRDVLFESSAWEASDEAGDKLELSDEQLSDGREFIQFKRLKLDSLVAGDQLEIPIFQTGKTYQAEITQAVANADGSVTFNGQLMDELGQVSSESGSPYSVTITSGQEIVSGGIFTPEGHFVIEAVGNQGWIANASTLFKFDENEPDYVVPESIE